MTDFLKVKFLAKDLKKIHEVHRGYLIASSHACNQINFAKIFHILENVDLANKYPESAFIAIRQLNLLRYSISAMFEFNDMTSKYFGKIRIIYPSFAAKHRLAYAPIARKLASAKWIKKIRNRISYHFDSDEMKHMLDNISDTQPLYLIFGNKTGEISYHFAEEIISANLAHEVGAGNLQIGSDAMFDLMDEISNLITNFHSRLIIDIFEQYGLFSNREHVAADRSSYATAGRDVLPVFLTSEN